MTERYCSTLAIVACTLLGACASLKHDMVQSTFRSTSAVETVGRTLFETASKCWRQQATPLREGIRISRPHITSDEVSFSATRYSVQTGQDDTPFLIVRITNLETGSQINVFEREFNCGFASCSSLGLASHVNQWIGGNLECKSVSIIFR